MQLKRCASSIVTNIGVERICEVREHKIQGDEDLGQLNKFQHVYTRSVLFVSDLSGTPFRYQLILAVLGLLT